MDRIQNLNMTRTKETSKESYKTSKSHNLFPSFKITNILFNTRNRELIIQPNYDPEIA